MEENKTRKFRSGFGEMFVMTFQPLLRSSDHDLVKCLLWHFNLYHLHQIMISWNVCYDISTSITFIRLWFREMFVMTFQHLSPSVRLWFREMFVMTFQPLSPSSDYDFVKCLLWHFNLYYLHLIIIWWNVYNYIFTLYEFYHVMIWKKCKIS